MGVDGGRGPGGGAPRACGPGGVGARALRRPAALAAALVAAAWLGPAAGAQLNLPQTPLFLAGSKAALVQLVVERDNKLFFEAYPSWEDIDGDGELDLRYDPANIDYYGYFGSGLCYRTVGAALEAVAVAPEKKCTDHPGTWSGDFLNYLTMTRMDVMLRALHGGTRSVDEADRTVLRRAFVPWDNHTWGIEYASEAVDGYRIEDYAPLTRPLAGHRHHFATNNEPERNDVPYLRVRQNELPEARIWDWVETEGAQGDGAADLDIVLDVRACKPGYLEPACRQYPNGHHKPVGLLHEYGENNRMYFGLLTGSYENNLRGGVVRRNLGSFSEEIDPETGQILDVGGIVHTLDALRIPNEYLERRRDQGPVAADCGYVLDRTFANGECKAWGNPVAEMMYEGLRHLAGEPAPTPSFHTTGGLDERLGLAAPAWENPWDEARPWPQCTAAYQLVVSDSNTSFDADQLPGSHFENFFDSSLGELHVGRLADTISSNEDALPGLKFIGESDGVGDRSPSPKLVDTFRTIRGQAPEEPHRQGGYYAPSVAWYGRSNDLNADAPGEQSVGNFTLALGSPLPTIDVAVGDREISFPPFGKTVGGCQYDGVSEYAPTNAIVGFTIEELTATSGTYRVAFEDMEQGADNDMDALLRYRYEVEAGAVTMEIESVSAAGCLIQHLGYSVSGSDADGVYLVVRDKDTPEGEDLDFSLDVPPGELPGGAWQDGEPLPQRSEITFRPSASPAAETLKSPLWYAAKWGGFDDVNGDGIPQGREWDADEDGDPDNWFEVSDPSKMADTLRGVFDSISEASATAAAVGVTGGSLSTGSRVYETGFRSGRWTGSLVSRAIAPDGTVSTVADWEASAALAAQIEDGEREILTWKPSERRGVPFRWAENPYEPTVDEIDLVQSAALSKSPVTGRYDLSGVEGSARVDWLRGAAVPGMRERDRPLGDIVHSTPRLVGPPVYRYRDDWGEGEPESAAPYSDFGRARAARDRVVYVGANDGMLHAFDAGELVDGAWSAGTGRERFAYLPGAVYDELPELTDPNYSHHYYVDATPTAGDAFVGGRWRTVLVGGLGRGGQAIYALDVTDPDAIDEARAADAVLWEFSDADDPDLGYTFHAPLIVRMHHGRWAAVFSGGYNAEAPDDAVGAPGRATLFVVDLETGALTAKLTAGTDTPGVPNALARPTAVDLDNDDVVDVVYAGDLQGRVWKFDVSAERPSAWGVVGDAIFRAVDGNGRAAPITAAAAVGRHPSGDGVLVYLATGKYLEPDDQAPREARNRIWALWDRDPFEHDDLGARLERDEFLEQSIGAERTVGIDADGDGEDETSAVVRDSTRRGIDWDRHSGWFLDLSWSTHAGEQVIAAPQLRENRLIVSTQVPGGDACSPAQGGWTMLLDAVSGAMPGSGLDLDGDGRFGAHEAVAGVRDLGNPMAASTIVAAGADDALLSTDEGGDGIDSRTLDARTATGRVSWRELEP